MDLSCSMPCVNLLKLVFGYVNDVFEYLEKDIDLISAFDSVCGLRATLQECRSESEFEELWQETVNTCNSRAIDIVQMSSRSTKKVSKSPRQYFTSDSSVVTAVDADVTTDIRKFVIEYYYSTVDILIREIVDRLDCQAMNTVRCMSTMCIWKDKTTTKVCIIWTVIYLQSNMISFAMIRHWMEPLWRPSQASCNTYT